jgi:hypothetical protein
MEPKLKKLAGIYDRFAAATEEFRDSAACGKGCAFCCTGAGSIDITTLEGLRIREALGRMLRRRQAEMKKALTGEMKKREAGIVVPCPFLQKNNTCNDDYDRLFSAALISLSSGSAVMIQSSLSSRHIACSVINWSESLS